MNETTLFLARLMGPVCLLLGISFAVHRDFYIDWFKKIKKNEAPLFFIAIVEATAGLAVVLNHNLWTSAPAIVISLLSYGMILEGASVLLGGKAWVKLAVRSMSLKRPLFLCSVLFVIVLGAYLSWIGYFAY